MRISFPAPLRCLLWLPLAAALATDAHATVTPVAWYRLGENDPGAASGTTVQSTTADFVWANPMKRFGTPFYTNGVSGIAASAVGSLLAVQFNGVNQYLSNAVPTTARNNVGIEAWVRADSLGAGTYIIAYNGNTAGNGWGLYRNGSSFGVAFGGVGTFGSEPIVVGRWVHLAWVRDTGTSTFYVNGSAVATSSSVPLSPTSGFALGTKPELPNGAFFNGAIDEVRVFTFTAGQFTPSDLLVNRLRVATLAASNLTNDSGTLNGTANPYGYDTTAWFEWGTTTNYGNPTAPQAMGNGTGDTNFSQTLNSLTLGATYHFRAVASNSFGLVTGADQSFTSPLFVLAASDLPALRNGWVAWGDYDNDGQLDLVFNGGISNAVGQWQPRAQIWRNDGNSFSNSNVSLTPVDGSSVAWGDANNDNRLDLLLSPYLAQNTGSGFSTTNLSWPQPAWALWGNYNRDGQSDVLLSAGGDFEVYQNSGGSFGYVTNGGDSATRMMDWGDYDNDGLWDVLVTGGNSPLVSQVWRNTGSGFSNVVAGLPGVYNGAVAWGDYDNDGLLDIALAGTTNGMVSGATAQVWRNTGSGFTNINADLPGFLGSVRMAWGDFDNDGRLDLVLAGATNFSETIPTEPVTQIWRNTAGGFTNINAILPGVIGGQVVWGDYDNDGRLDLLLTGASLITTNGVLTNFVTQLWRNNASLTNSPPSPPDGLSVTAAGNTLTFSWNAANDAQTPAPGLTYNLRIGTTPGGSDIMSAAALSTGQRLLPQRGNVQHAKTAVLANVDFGVNYYWSVQAVDTSFAGGPFAAEGAFSDGVQLSITNAGTNVLISWTPSLPGWFLQETTNLSTAVWDYSPSGPANPVVVPATLPTKFYRLFKP